MERVMTSRSLVGSSSSSTLGASISTDSRYSRRRSPPDSRPMGTDCKSPGNMNRSIIWLAVKVPSSVRTSSAMSWIKS